MGSAQKQFSLNRAASNSNSLSAILAWVVLFSGFATCALSQPSTNLVVNGGFEAPAIPSGTFQYYPPTNGWDYIVPASCAGVVCYPNSVTGFSSASAPPAGQRYGFLQTACNSPLSSFSQVVTLPTSGKYLLTYYDAGRVPIAAVGGNVTYYIGLAPTVSIGVVATNVVLTFPAVSNALYNVQTTTDLVASAWSLISSNVAAGAGVATNFPPGGATDPQRFYKVGSTLATNATTSSQAFTQKSIAFNAAAGTYRLIFSAVGATDNTAFFDEISLTYLP